MSEKTSVGAQDWHLMAEICRRYYIQEEKQALIANQLHINLSRVSRYLKKARELGVVKFHIEEESGLGRNRLPELERELLRHFKLDRAIVIDFPYHEDTSGFEDDRLHQALGYACADFLRTWLRSNDHVGVGGGRGAYYTAKYLRDTAAHPLQKRLTGITVTSLTGSMSTTPWNSYTPIVDADQAAAILADAFGSATHRLLNAPVAPPSCDVDVYWESGSARVLSLETWRTEQKKFVPNVGLLGVGALAGQHRFFQQGEHQLDALRVLQPQLRELLKIVSSHVKKGYYPVGDICNRLFFIEPLPGVQVLDESEESTIKRLIDELNGRILSVTEDHLRLIRENGTLIAVAGGAVKLDAISSLLTRAGNGHLTVNTLGSDISVDILCTDVTSAERLLRRVLGQAEAF